MENDFLTPEVCSFDPWGGGHSALGHHRTNTQQHKNREFDVFYKKCSFDLVDIQASNQTIDVCKTLLYEKENKMFYTEFIVF